MANRTYPNSNFAWYNDDNRIAIVARDDTSTSGERTKEKYDTFQDADVTGGLRITTNSRFDYVDAQTDNLKTNIGLDTGLHLCVVCYLKSRMFEDAGDLQQSQYFRTKFENGIAKKPTRKSGVRVLLVPEL